jgi:glycosyltransferase involved in cell wall biosynthesis
VSLRLSAVVVAQNEEKNIGRCLQSVRFTDEIVVVDAFSEDRTPDISRSLGARVISRAWDGFASQKQFAIDQARGEWVLLVDSDEEVSADLALEIRSAIEGDPASLPPGYRIRRSNFFMGQAIPHGPWGRDSTVRVFQKGRASVSARPVHEGIRLDGAPGSLRGPLYHRTHQTLSESFRRLNRYTSLEAAERVSRRNVGLFDVVLPPLGVFIRYYIIGGCWRAGTRGFLLSATTSMYRSILYAKIYLLQSDAREQTTPRT